jgi:autotransporter-associated beta strand protein
LSVSGWRMCPTSASAGFGLDRGSAVLAVARSTSLAFAMVLLAGHAALAVCTPTWPVDNATVTCTGATIDQSLTAGYGTSTDTGNVITVAAGASVTGTGSRDGLIFDTATVLNQGTITGGLYGIQAGANFADVTNAGTISGSIAAIQFFGNGNTLTLTPGSVINGLVQSTAGGNIFQLGGSGAGTFDISALGDSAQYRNFGTLNKIDSSVWTLTGAATFGGDVNVNGGTLLVNGSLASANTIFVSPGATLGGTGTLPSTFLDDGATLAPGTPATIGTLTVNTILLFCNCSVYSVKVSGLSADKTQVNGDVFLSEAPVVATVTGSSIAKRYTILTASGGLNDTFGTVTGNTPAGFTPSLSYDANNVYLNYQFAPLLPAGLNGNQQSVAGAATAGAGNIFNAGGAIPVAFGALTPAMLTQMSGEIATGSQQTTFDAMTQFMALMTDPFTAGRGFEAPGAIGFAEGDATHAYAATSPNRTGSECEAYGMITRAAPAPAFDARWSVWAAGFGGRPDHRRQRGARIEHGHESSRCGRRRRGLLVLAADHRRLCARGRRHEFQRRRWRKRALRPVPGRRLRPSHGWVGLCHRGGGPWLARHRDQSHRDDIGHRSTTRALQRQCILGTRRGRQSHGDVVDGRHRPDTVRRGAGDQF